MLMTRMVVFVDLWVRAVPYQGIVIFPTQTKKQGL